MVIYDNKIFCTTLFWCLLKRPSIELRKLLLRCLNAPWKSFYVNLAFEQHSEGSSAVTLLLHADLMMVKNASNQPAPRCIERTLMHWEDIKTWTGVHGPPHGPGPWTIPNFQKEIALLLWKFTGGEGMENADSYLLLTPFRVCLVIAGCPIELQFEIVGIKILGAEMQ